MAEYVLTLDKPHLSTDGVGVVYKRRHIEKTFGADDKATTWARHAIANEHGFWLAGITHPGKPLALWRFKPGGGLQLIWGDSQIRPPEQRELTPYAAPVDTPRAVARLLRRLAEQARYGSLRQEITNLAEKLDKWAIASDRYTPDEEAEAGAAAEPAARGMQEIIDAFRHQADGPRNAPIRDKVIEIARKFEELAKAASGLRRTK
jgi:hypothetical protein